MKKGLWSYFLVLTLGIILAIITLSLQRHSFAKKSLLEVQNKINNLGRLVLLEQQYRSILSIENTKKILGIPLPGNKMLLAVPYRVTYGIDLSKGVQIKAGIAGCTIYYPDPEIFEIQVINSEIETFLSSGRIRIDDFLPVIEKNKAELFNSLSQDYQGKVLKNLEVFFLTTLSNLGIKSIELRGKKV
ncbi:MAG: DUF4230 domain-containing protein [Spirochaetia bacterium]